MDRVWADCGGGLRCMVQYGTGSGYGESAVGVFCILSSRDFVGGWQKLYWHVYDMIFEFGDGLWAPRVGVGLGEVSDCGALYVSSGVMVEWKSGKWQSVGGLCVPEPEREREVKLNSHNVIAVSPYVMAWHSRLIEIFSTRTVVHGRGEEGATRTCARREVSEKAGRIGY